MDIQTAVYAALVLFVAYLIRGIAGFGSGLIAVPMLTLVAPVPLVVPLVVALDKSVFRATFAINFLIDGAIRLVSYAILGLFRWQLLVYLLVSLPIVGAGLYLGGRLHTGLSQNAFVHLISLLLLGSGVALLIK
jgi:uncharacterized membrane protein YfcA